MLIDFRHGNAQKLANLLRGHHGPRRRAMGHRVTGSTTRLWQARMSSQQSITGEATVTFNTEDDDVKRGNIWTLAAGEVLIDTGGIGRFTYTLQWLLTGTNVNEGKAFIEQKPDGGAFAEIESSFSICLLNATDAPLNTGDATIHHSMLVKVTAGDTFRIRADRSDAGSTPVIQPTLGGGPFSTGSNWNIELS